MRDLNKGSEGQVEDKWMRLNQCSELMLFIAVLVAAFTISNQH